MGICSHGSCTPGLGRCAHREVMRLRTHAVGVEAVVAAVGSLVAVGLVAVGSVALGGCKFDDTGLSPGADLDAAIIGGNPIDASIDGDPTRPVDASVEATTTSADDIIHVPPTGERLGSGDLVLSGQVRIDTTNLDL